MWYYANDGQRSGPCSDQEFQSLVACGVIHSTTLVWREGMAEWVSYSTLSGLQPSAAPSAEKSRERVAFEFSGDTSDYFRIWIVNLMLTIATLGIYAAWAKVRNKKYFYSNTKLFGHSFEYTGDAKRILVGNIIVVGLFGCYQLAPLISPAIGIGLFFVILAIVPWIIVKSLSFNARNTRYRGLQFGFDGTYKDAAIAFLAYPMLVPLSLGLALPSVVRKQKEFIVGNYRYGNTRFAFSGTDAGIYSFFWKTLAFFSPLIVGYIIFIFAIGFKESVVFLMPLATAFILAGWILGFLYGQFFWKAHLFNYVWKNTRLASHGFTADMPHRKLMNIQVMNSLGILVSAGLLFPWARIRMTKFTLESLQVLSAGSLDDLKGEVARDASAVGESAGDIFDFDVGLGA